MLFSLPQLPGNVRRKRWALNSEKNSSLQKFISSVKLLEIKNSTLLTVFPLWGFLQGGRVMGYSQFPKLFTDQRWAKSLCCFASLLIRAFCSCSPAPETMSFYTLKNIFLSFLIWIIETETFAFLGRFGCWPVDGDVTSRVMDGGGGGEDRHRFKPNQVRSPFASLKVRSVSADCKKKTFFKTLPEICGLPKSISSS